MNAVEIFFYSFDIQNMIEKPRIHWNQILVR